MERMNITETNQIITSASSVKSAVYELSWLKFHFIKNVIQVTGKKLISRL